MSFKNPFPGEKLDKLVELVLKYIEVKSELIKLQLKEQVFQIISALALIFGLLVFAFLILIILSFAISQFLNDLLESRYLGHLIVSGFYLLVFILIYIYRNVIVQKEVMKIIIKDHFEQENKKEEDAS